MLSPIVFGGSTKQITTITFVQPNNELIQALEAKGAKVHAPLNEADLAIRYPTKELVSFMSMLTRSPVLMEKRRL